MNFNGFAKVIQIHGSIGITSDHNVANMQAAQDFVHRIMRVLRVIHHAIREHLTGKKNTIEIALGTAISYITPSGFFRSVGQFLKYINYIALKFVGVDVVVCGNIGITYVI